MSERSEKLFDGITHIREELVEQAAVTKKKRGIPRRWWIRGAAAVLALVFVLGVMLDPKGGGGSVASAYAIAEAEYPEMAPYPQGEGTVGFDGRYDRWQDSINAQRQPKGYADGLQDYFAAGIRQFLTGAGEENKVYSPVNVYMALAMLAEVTDGNSRRQILDLLGSDSIESLRKQATAVWNAQYRDDGAVTRKLAGSLWLNEDIDFVPSTMNTLADTYYASSYRGEMGSDEFNAALQGWLNEQTGGLLEEQVKSVEMSAETILAIAATVYYKAAWRNEFRADRNTQDIFHGAAGDVTCEFMHQSRTDTYYWGEKFSTIRRGMEAQGGAMWFILPDEGYTPDDLLADEQAMRFIVDKGDWENSKHLIVNQAIPKFDVTAQIDLREGLQALGITDVFDPAISDFTPMTTDRDDIFLSKARHDARVVIDEEGVEAAAFTVLMATTSSAPPEEKVDFVADRPFLFVITGENDLPLFVGVVNQP